MPNRGKKHAEKETIHWHGTPPGVCERKDEKLDQVSIKHGPVSITNTALAHHFGNVTCPVCREYHRQQWHKKRRA